MEDMAPFTDDFARNLYVFSWINTMAMLNSQIYIYILYTYIPGTQFWPLSWMVNLQFYGSKPWHTLGQNWVPEDCGLHSLEVEDCGCFFTSYQRNFENWGYHWVMVGCTYIYIMCVLFLLAFTLIWNSSGNVASPMPSTIKKSIPKQGWWLVFYNKWVNLGYLI